MKEEMKIRVMILSSDGAITIILSEIEHDRFVSLWDKCFPQARRQYDGKKEDILPESMVLVARDQDTNAAITVRIQVDEVSVIESCYVQWSDDNGYSPIDPK